MIVDPLGEFGLGGMSISISIGASIGAGVGYYQNGVKGALIGALAGGAAGAIGVLSLSGALALCGYYGFSTLGTLFIAGTVSGMVSGTTGGFIEGLGYSMLDGNDFYASFYQGIARARTGAGIGGVIGGIFAPGIFVARNGIQFVRSVQAARAILEAEQAAGRITTAEANALRANLGRFSTAEDTAEAILKQYEASAGANAHFLSRHGAQTTVQQQLQRAQTGITPDGFHGRSTDATRFISHQDQLEAYNIAMQMPVKSNTPFTMNRVIGEGFLKGGTGQLQTTNVVQPYFDSNGKLISLFPLL
jgi:hypothetical protein